VAFGAVSAAPAVWLGVLLATFAAHVACHLPHHPWFLVKVLWPVATTMVITDLLHLLPAVMVSSRQHTLLQLWKQLANHHTAAATLCSSCRACTCPAQQQLHPCRSFDFLPTCRPVLVGVQASGGGGLGGAGRVQALLAALLSVKAISKLSRWALAQWRWQSVLAGCRTQPVLCMCCSQ
jgi:hypothetical protein